MVWLFAIATGLIVANLYYAQTLIGPISKATGLDPGAAGLIVTLTRSATARPAVHRAAGRPGGKPPPDLHRPADHRAGPAGRVVTSSANLFLFAALCIGLGSVAAQIVVPFAAHLSRPERAARPSAKS
jgi:hypothetical protein